MVSAFSISISTIDFTMLGLGEPRVVHAGVVERIFFDGTVQRSAPSLHQVAIELFGRGLGRDIELPSQHVATHPILAQRFRI